MTITEQQLREWEALAKSLRTDRWARTAVPALIAEVRRLQKEREVEHTVGWCSRYAEPDDCRGSDDCITEWCFGCLLAEVDERRREPTDAGN